jgi:hypothetical protein
MSAIVIFGFSPTEYRWAGQGRKATIGNKELSFCFLINNEGNRRWMTIWKKKDLVLVKPHGTKAG